MDRRGAGGDGDGDDPRRRLPAEQVVWLVIGTYIFRDLSMRELVSTIDLALPGSRGIRVAPSSIVQARERRGDKPLRWLFERTGSTWALVIGVAHDEAAEPPSEPSTEAPATRWVLQIPLREALRGLRRDR